MKQILSLFTLFALPLISFGQEENSSAYKKRVLEQQEFEFLTSYYSQDGDNAAVSGGIGTEKLTDFTPTVVVSIPVNEDDVLTVDFGISAYTSASSSNVNPFDSENTASPFQASSGASGKDTWMRLNGNYSHSSDDRNKIWSGNLSISSEYDYFSIGAGASHTWLFNEKNTEFGIHGSAYIDKWKLITPVELRYGNGVGDDDDDDDFNINTYTITGNSNYNPSFVPQNKKGRNSFAFGANLSQILSKNLHGALALDAVIQNGLLSTPFQRVYFSDIADSFIEDFHLADDIERLPDTRFKLAVGGRLNYFVNPTVSVRTFFRYYSDDWGISSSTASIEIPIKVSDKITVYPSYRFYDQSAADHFAPYEGHISSSQFYTSDYDLSAFNANQYGFGVSYTDVFTSLSILKLGLKSIDLKVNYYERNTGLNLLSVALGLNSLNNFDLIRDLFVNEFIKTTPAIH